MRLNYLSTTTTILFFFLIIFLSNRTTPQTTQSTKYCQWKLQDITKANQIVTTSPDLSFTQVVSSGSIYYTGQRYYTTIVGRSLHKIKMDTKQQQEILSITPPCLTWISHALYVERDSEEIYYLETEKNQLFRIDWDSQNCTLIAGTGKKAYSGDGGSALNATFSSPSSLQVLKNEIYIADTDNRAVRRIKDGIITTIATFNDTVNGIHVADSEMFLIVSNQVIQYSLITGTRKVIAGNNTLGSGFSGDGGLAVNAQFNFASLVGMLKVSNMLYVTEISKIRSINLENGIVNTFAGKQHNTQFVRYVGNGDGGLAKNAILGNLAPYLSFWNGDIYFSDPALFTIRRVNLQSGIISLVSGKIRFDNVGPFIDGFPAINVLLFNPTSIILDSNENLLVSDADCGILFKISKDGLLHSVLPNNYESFSDVNPPLMQDVISIGLHEGNTTIVSSKGYLQQLDQNFNIKMIGGPLTPSRFSSSKLESLILNSPKGLYAENNTVYIADSGNHRIIKVNILTKEVSHVAGSGIAGFSNGLALTSKLNSPTGIHMSENIMYIADTKNHMIRRLDLQSGLISTLAGTGILGFSGDFSNATLAEINSPTYVMKQGEFVYFSDTNNNRIRRIHLESNIITTVIGTGIQGFNGDGLNALSSHISNPKGLVVVNDLLYFSDTGNQRIRFFNLSEGLVNTFAGTGESGSSGLSTTTYLDAVFNNPSSLSYYNDIRNYETFLISDSYNHQVKSLSKNVAKSYLGSGIKGNSFITKDTGLSSINMNTPECSVFDSTYGTRFVSDTLNNRIIYYDYINLYTIGGSGDNGNIKNAQITASNIAISPKTGNLYIVESSQNRIRKVSNEGIVSTVAGNGIFGGSEDGKEAKISSLATPTGIFISKNDELIFTEIGTSKVRTINQRGELATLAGNGFQGFNGDGISAKSAALNYPVSIQLSATDLFISDSQNSLIRIVGLNDSVINSINGEYSPGNLAVTSDNIVYFIDTKTKSIRKFTPYCDEGYYLFQNRTCLPICFGRIDQIDSKTCSGKGYCRGFNQCSCFSNSGYAGKECEIPICFGIMATETAVCSNSNGTCTEPNICKCNIGFTGSECQTPVCFGKYGEMACGGTGRGQCFTKDKCNCLKGYAGNECQLFECSGLAQNDPNVCSGRGKCTAPNFCSCSFGHSGDSCESSENLYITIGVSIFAVSLIICISISLIFIIACLWRKNKKQKRILETDGYMGERLLNLSEWSLEPQSNNIHGDSSFFIPLEQLNMTDSKTTKKIGSGISSVFKTVWNGQPVAVKIYDLNNFETDEEQFIQEAKLLSTLRHPNVITFYGISTSTTKRYIIMELMESSLQQVISNLQKAIETISLKQKIQLLINIVSGVDYLHHLKPNKIVHRDLKPANILYQNGNCKLCDFGLSRAMSNNANSMITNNIGTIYYCAPEVSGVIDSETVSAIDIYSLSIIMWQLIFEIADPYNYVSSSVYQKLNLNSPISYPSLFHLHKQICENQARPSIPFDSLETCREWLEKFGNVEQAPILFELCELIKLCWSHSPKDRPSTTEIKSKLSSFCN